MHAPSGDQPPPNRGRALRAEPMHRRVEVGGPARRILAQSARAIAQSRKLEVRVRELKAHLRASNGRAVTIADAALATLAAARGTRSRQPSLRLVERATRGAETASRRATEEARAEADVSALVRSDLVAAVSHEMRTPLQAILGYAELLTECATGSFAETREFARRIVISSLSLTQVVENLIQLSAAQLGRIQLDIRSFDVRRLISDVLRLANPLARHKKIGLRADLVPLEMTSDMRRLRQIVANLVENAIKRTESGEVVVSLAADEASDRSTVRITVRDSGRGIDEADLPHVFEPFWQGREPVPVAMHDTGLNLSTVRHLTRLLGGEVRAETAPFRGSTFTVELPRVAP